MRRIFLALLASSTVAGFLACSESTDGVTPDGGTSTDASTTSDGGSPNDDDKDEEKKDGATFDAQTVANSVVVINEISGSDEWIEIVNGGTSAVDVSGWKVADRDKDTGEPKLAEAATLPSGTVLSPNAYAIVKGGGLDAGKTCPDGGQSYCVNAEFGISNKNGETIFLLLPDGGTAGTVVYPADAAVGDDTWGRLPNGSPDASFVITTATPGAPNQAK